ncbi:Multidrug resistance protein 1 [Bulinus truncatus]|nr:Multidrug resistance protein 1 [Bulinus truncatus]
MAELIEYKQNSNEHNNTELQNSSDGKNVYVNGVSIDLKHSKNEKNTKEKPPMVGIFEVFRFSDGKDKLMMFVGALSAAVGGAALPVMIIVFGSMIDLFVDSANMNLNATSNQTDSGDINLKPILDKMTEFAIYYCIIGGGVLIASYLQVSLWMTAAERQAHRIRQHFLKNILRQDIGWFDTHEAAELNTRLADDITKIQDGIGDKMGSFVQWFASFVAGFVIGFANGWKLTLVILAVSPFLVGAAGLFSKLAASMTSKELEAYAKAGGVAEEVFGAIRTVVAFGGQEKESDRLCEL